MARKKPGADLDQGKKVFGSNLRQTSKGAQMGTLSAKLSKQGGSKRLSPARGVLVRK